ncbi:BTAD domain-containing putative transcriptional regulator [Egibacter rhizosphaerae]|uniref:BTAD domain-containing putative transcriptional regulator n=1 Tax=Egibacter rhizosphaerae TaxID=1670831 RepID=UPI00197AC77A|nr:BTAD domain-containing putative transcriptional regulator [Egibacter rhizosphaerae]
MVQVELLSGVRATTDIGEPLDVGPAKCQAVLATLALSVGDAVPVPRLIDVVWGQDPPRTADKTLQGYAARLRKALGTDAIVRTGAAYRLDLDPGAVDVARFRHHVGAGEVDAALATWTGMPLAGLDAPRLQPAVDALVEQWLGAVEYDLGRRVRAEPARAIATLTELTADHPFREELWALLMTALYRAGRQADALAAFQRAREHLVDELGVEPGPRLREVEAQVLDHDAGLRGGQPPPVSPSQRRGNLPHRPGRLVGRDAELDAIADALQASQVLTLVGPGGIGKTALAAAAAHRSEANGRRVWLVELAEIASSGEVARAVAETLGVTGGAGRTLTESVVAALGAHHTMLVLDNCEHVVDGAAALARAIAEDGADTRVLATSREGLAIAGEQLITVGPLDPAGAAVELFADRARAVGATFDLHVARAEIEQVCRQLDGLPLAVELAAALSRTLTPAQLRFRLDDHLRLLGSGRPVAERHRTLQATVQWSYDLLSPAQQVTFDRLAVFAGPFDLAAAEAVAAPELDTVDADRLVSDLVERSMVTVEAGPFGRRFRLLETLRQFASERLAAHGAVDQVAARHARWCRGEVVRIQQLLTGHGEVEGVAQLAELWSNLRAAFDWACTTGDVQLADALVRPVAPEVNLRRQAEIGDWAERILDLTPPDDEAAVVFWLLWAADRRAQADDHEAYERVVTRHGHTNHPVLRFTHTYMYDDSPYGHESSLEAVAWLRAHGEDHAADLVEIAGVGAGLMTRGRFAELDALASEMAERYRAHGPPTFLYFALGLRGYAAQFAGRHSDATRIFTQSARIDTPSGTYRVSQPMEARAVFDQGHRPLAVRMLREHVEELLDTDYTDVTRMVSVEFITMMVALDRRAEAARVLAYLDTTGDFGALARETLIADAVRTIDADPALAPGQDRNLDAHNALLVMRDTLDELARDSPVV